MGRHIKKLREMMEQEVPQSKSTGRTFTDKEALMVDELYEKGWTRKRIAKELGVSDNVIGLVIARRKTYESTPKVDGTTRRRKRRKKEG